MTQETKTFFEQWQEAAERFAKPWEEAATRWWDDQLREPGNLEALGGLLSGLSTMKERTDRALEEYWSRWRLPSAADVERLHERLGEIQDQLDRLEELLEPRATPAPGAPARGEGGQEKAARGA